MKRIYYILFGLACAFGGFLVRAVLESRDIAILAHEYLPWIAIVALAGLGLLGACLIAAYLYARYRLRKLLNADTPLTETEIAEGLVDIFTNPEGINDPTPQDRQHAVFVSAGAWILRRYAMQFYFNATVTVIGGLVGAMTLFLLYEQNQKIELQNEKITLQTDANITQSVLLEGTRRAALAADMASLFRSIQNSPSSDKPNCEGVFWEFFDCWETDEDGERVLFHLPRSLVAQVETFAQRNTPYRLAVVRTEELNFDLALRHQFQFPALSPERGQLLLMLTINQIATARFDFSYGQLTQVDLREKNLWATKLSNSDLQRASLVMANLEGAALRNANLSFAFLEGANLRRSDLTGADLTNADLSLAYLEQSNLRMATLQNANLKFTELLMANVSGADFVGGKFDGDTNFQDAWAWQDEPPIGLPENAQIALCEFDPETDDRNTRPTDCRR